MTTANKRKKHRSETIPIGMELKETGREKQNNERYNKSVKT